MDMDSNRDMNMDKDTRKKGKGHRKEKKGHRH
jgi:hypothetical protein